MAGNCKEDSFGSQQGFSTVAAVAAWGLPAAHTIAVLVTRDVDADELTGRALLKPFQFYVIKIQGRSYEITTD